MSLEIRALSVADLRSDPNNVREHSAENIKAVKASLENFGQRKPIVVTGKNVVVAGNGTLQAASELGWDTIATVVVPSDWSDEQVRAYAIADNRTAELATWNKELLAQQLDGLSEYGFDLNDLGFGDTLLMSDGLGGSGESSDNDVNVYSAAVEVPQYQIIGDEPAVQDLFDNEKAEAFSAEIMAKDLPEAVRDFLLAAASRHVVFDYGKIAEFYPHQTKEVQELMEKSALIIIDLNNAMLNGYASLMSAVTMQREAERGLAQ